MERRESTMEKMVKRVLVTGSDGYIGAVLMDTLLNSKYDCTGIDTGFFSHTSLGQYNRPYTYIQKDIRDIEESDLKGFDAIIHLAAISNDPMGALSASITEAINAQATIRLATLAKSVGVKRFIFSSSCSVYGIADGTVSEASPVHPLTAYAVSKVQAETALQGLADSTFTVGLLRNATVYGYSPRFRNDLVVNNFVTCAVATKEIRVMSDGTPWRPLIDVRDLSRVFCEFLRVDAKSINGTVVNIGFRENNVQVKDILSTLVAIYPDVKVIYTGEHGSDSRSYKVDFSLFEQLFPHIKMQWSIEKSMSDLIQRLESAQYSSEHFSKGEHTRLKILKTLLDDTQVDKTLRWIKPLV